MPGMLSRAEASLADQQRMRHAGFVEVDCRFKWLEMALMVGVRGLVT